MSSTDLALASPVLGRRSLGLAWGQVVFASLAMTATLPGRTHGLGLVTEPLLQDLHFDRVMFANINLAATVIGAGMGAIAGWAIDRWGTRRTAVVIGIALALSVFALTRASGAFSFLAALTLIRGFGQSALSVVSLAIIGKWFVRGLGYAMAVFALLITMGFIATVLGMGAAVQQFAGPVSGEPPVYAHPEQWRYAWNMTGWMLLLGFAPLAWLIVRDTPESCGYVPDVPDQQQATNTGRDFTFVEAMRSPTFWVFAATTAFFNLIWSGVTLFNESILAERGFDPQAAVQCLAIVTGTGMLANIAAGALARRRSIGSLLGFGMAILAVGLACFPSITTQAQLQCYAAAVGVAGGIVTVVFFAVWGQLFGRSQLGKVQGAAQVLATLASAAGPLILASIQSRTASYSPALYVLAGGAALLAVASACVPLPVPPE